MAIQDVIRSYLGVDREIAELKSQFARERDQLEEAYESEMRMLQRQIEALGELSLNAVPNQDALAIPPERRKDEIKRARKIRASNPIAKRSVTLVVHYTLGDGVTVKAQDPQFVGPVINEFWNDPDNKIALTSHEAMSELVDSLMVDGELYLAFFIGENGEVKVRTIDPLEIDDVITHPDDARRPLLYKRTFKRRTYDAKRDEYVIDSQPRVLYYRDIENRFNEIDPDRDPIPVPANKLAPAYIYHVKINKQGKFGSSELYASLEWARAFKTFMDDRVAINKAAAAITHVRKVAGTPEAVRQAARAVPGQYGDPSRFLPNGVARTTAAWVVNSDAIQDQWMKTDTGALNAIEDARMLLMIFGAGVGIPMHWLGEGGDANLATAAAMNEPVIRQFQFWQQLWRGIFTVIFRVVILEAVRHGRIPGEIIEDPERGTLVYALKKYGEVDRGVPENDEEQKRWEAERNQPISDWVDIDFPPIILKDVKNELIAIEALGRLMPPGNLEAVKVIVSMALTALGINDVDKVMDQIFYDGYELPDVVMLRQQMQQAAQQSADQHGMNEEAREALMQQVNKVFNEVAAEIEALEALRAAREASGE